jgi:hypothetical protein
MDSTLKALLAKAWKDEALDLEPGRHDLDEMVMVRVTGSVTKAADQMVAPTVSIPLITTLSLFWEKAGIARDHALRLLREAILEAMADGANTDERIEARMKDVEKAVEAVKKDLISKLPKQKRAGRVVTKDLEIEVQPVHEDVFTPAA